MRELKFRAWDGKKMIFDDHSTYVTNHGVFNEYEETNESGDDYMVNIIDQSTDYVLMQYTGLKDKNGKEIYEGDIVKWTNKEIEIVEYINGAFCGRNIPLCITEDGDIVDTEEHCKIIGNIYENPELLN